MEFYVLVVSGGVEIEKDGPLMSGLDQLARAKELWRDCDPMNGDNLFWLDVDLSAGTVSVGSFNEGDLTEDVG